MSSGIVFARRGKARLIGLVVSMLMTASTAWSGEIPQEKLERILSLADSAYGEYLAGQCVTCHLPEGAEKGIPLIHGQPDVHLVRTLLEYKIGGEGRTNPVMASIAKNLSEEEMGSLARYFSEQGSDR